MISVILLVAVTWALVALGVGTAVGRLLAAGDPEAQHDAPWTETAPWQIPVREAHHSNR